MAPAVMYSSPASDGTRATSVTGVQTCALPVSVRLTVPPLRVKVEVLPRPIPAVVNDPPRLSVPPLMLMSPRLLQVPPRSEERRVGKERRPRALTHTEHGDEVSEGGAV